MQRLFKIVNFVTDNQTVALCTIKLISKIVGK